MSHARDTKGTLFVIALTLFSFSLFVNPTRAQEPELSDVTPISVWVISDQGADEEGEYVFSYDYDEGAWYDKDGSGSIMWRSDIDLRDVHGDPDLNGIWIRDNRGSG